MENLSCPIILLNSRVTTRLARIWPNIFLRTAGPQEGVLSIYIYIYIYMYINIIEREREFVFQASILHAMSKGKHSEQQQRRSYSLSC